MSTKSNFPENKKNNLDSLIRPSKNQKDRVLKIYNSGIFSFRKKSYLKNVSEYQKKFKKPKKEKIWSSNFKNS